MRDLVFNYHIIAEKVVLVKENIKLRMVIYIFMKRKYQMNYMKSLGLLQMRKFIGFCQNIYGSFLLMM
ncbi:hypothetical protein DWZ43_00025 [Ruminococcus sp. AF32-2AC]|nr:hypothetical protein DWZ43_00025 [Ruminococcus sp. AF32-2AC]RGH62632.1 hypothetical protein DW815_14565 [Ruminococcus sp. AM33-14]